jgi:hypothetical protein
MKYDIRRLARSRSIHDAAEYVRLRMGLYLTDFRLRFFPPFLNRRWLAPGEKSASATPGPATRKKIQRLVGAMRIAASRRFGGEMTCLRRSLVLRARLAKAGIRTRLVYGARKIEGKARAHAWLESGSFRIDSYETSQEFERFQARGKTGP